MKELTPKEEEIMQMFWKDGALFVKEIVEKYPDPKPHFNTLSTYVRALEEKGLLSHESFGTTYRYFPVISETEYNNGTLKNVVKKYFNNSYLNVVSAFIRSENLSVDEIRKLLDEVEQSEL
jgi:BlaI family transcriptional regulator, penicillinase repressor